MKPTYVTKGRAKTEYCLTEKDLSNILSIERPNPHYRHSSPMQLFDVDNLKLASFRKHVVPPGDNPDNWTFDEELFQEILATFKTKRDAASNKRRKTVETKKSLRKTVLVHALQSKGLNLRGDSLLCKEFILRGNVMDEENVYSVVDTMEAMKWFYDNTKLSRTLQTPTQ